MVAGVGPTSPPPAEMENPGGAAGGGAVSVVVGGVGAAPSGEEGVVSRSRWALSRGGDVRPGALLPGGVAASRDARPPGVVSGDVASLRDARPGALLPGVVSGGVASSRDARPPGVVSGGVPSLGDARPPGLLSGGVPSLGDVRPPGVSGDVASLRERLGALLPGGVSGGMTSLGDAGLRPGTPSLLAGLVTMGRASLGEERVGEGASATVPLPPVMLPGASWASLRRSTASEAGSTPASRRESALTPPVADASEARGDETSGESASRRASPVPRRGGPLVRPVSRTATATATSRTKRSTMTAAAATASAQAEVGRLRSRARVPSARVTTTRSASFPRTSFKTKSASPGTNSTGARRSSRRSPGSGAHADAGSTCIVGVAVSTAARSTPVTTSPSPRWPSQHTGGPHVQSRADARAPDLGGQAPLRERTLPGVDSAAPSPP